MVLSAGERRAYTANDILRDPSWRKRDADGALRISVEDAGGHRRRRRRSGPHHDGGRQRRRDGRGERRDAARATCRCPTDTGSTTSTADGRAVVPGVAPNALTSTEWRDAYAGTPWHKHVPARIERVPDVPRSMAT